MHTIKIPLPAKFKPSQLPMGKRQDALDALALRANMLARSDRYLNLWDWHYRQYPRSYNYNERYFPTHPVHIEVRELLLTRSALVSEFDFDRAALLLDSDPNMFSWDDFNLAVRALWKSDRVGFHKGGNEAYRDGYIAALIRNWDNPIVLASGHTDHRA